VEKPLAALLVFLDTSKVFLHVVWRTKDKRDSLVNTLRFHIQHCLRPCSCHPACLLNDESHRVAFIEKSELERKREHVIAFRANYTKEITRTQPSF